MSINTQTIAQPNGRNLWQIGGDDYLQTKMHVPAIGTGEANSRSLPSMGHGGKYCYEIVVTDETGNPVEGASLVLGKDSIFTDSQGRTSIREKQKTMPLRVDLDNFMLPGTWEIVSAPVEAKPGEPVRIVVKRKPR